MTLKPTYDIHRTQHFVREWREEGFLDFLEGEGFTYGFGRQALVDSHGYLCIDMAKRALFPLGNLSHAPAGQGIVMKPEEFREIYAELKTEAAGN